MPSKLYLVYRTADLIQLQTLVAGCLCKPNGGSSTDRPFIIVLNGDHDPVYMYLYRFRVGLHIFITSDDK